MMAEQAPRVTCSFTVDMYSMLQEEAKRRGIKVPELVKLILSAWFYERNPDKIKL